MLLTLIAVTVFFAVITGAESLALTIGGGIATLITWGIKSYFDVNGKAAFILTAVVSTVVAIAALLITGDPSLKLLFSGDISNLGELYKAGVFVVGIATAVYKLLLADRAKASA